MAKLSTFQLILITFAFALILGMGGIVFLAAKKVDLPAPLTGAVQTIIGALAMAFQMQAKSTDKEDKTAKTESAS